jgi:hypothetical protein
MRTNAKAVFAKIRARLESAINDIPKVIANEGQKHFNEQFRSQSLEGQKWPEVKRRQPGTFEYKYPKKKYLARRSNPILVGKTRMLKNAVNRSVKRVTRTGVIWGVYGSEGKYGSLHNMGIGQKPRPFMRDTRKFRNRLRLKGLQVIRKGIR